jgi:hypothetical protein
MTTKLIAGLIIVAVLYGGWNLFVYWEKVKDEKESIRKEAAASVVTENSLAGLPYNLESSLQAAKRQGAVGLKNWLKTYGNTVQDPRKAWIELDYCVMIARDDPAEARRVFAAVRERTGPASPVWQRIKQLAPTYE